MSRSLPANVAAVLYDLDGVLIDSRRAWYESIRRGRERWGYEPLSWDEFEPTFGQGVEADVTMFFPRHSVEQLAAWYDESMPGCLGDLEALPGALELLDTIRTRGVKQAVVTNSPRPLAEKILARTGIAERIDALAAAGDAPDKPAPDLLWLAMQRLDVTKDRVVYVGDSPTDCEAASAANVFLVGIGLDGDARVERVAELVGVLDG